MPAIGDYQSISVSMLDHSNELRAVSIPVGVLTVGTLPGFLDQYGDFQTALDAITLGTIARQRWGQDSVISNTPPASAAAQIETEILVRVRGATSETPASFRVPTADYTAFNWIGDEAILTGAGATAATTNFVNAVQALMQLPGGETVEVYSIRVVE